VTENHPHASRYYELLVDRGHVLQGLQIFRVPRKVRPCDRAILGFDGSYLTVEAFDQMFVARATGAWPGNARVGATLIAALKQAPPAGDPLIVRSDGKRVSLGSMRIDCEWQPVSAALVAAPTASDWLGALALSYSMPRGRIVTEGFAKEVHDAERKLSQLVARVGKSLAPLGVTKEDVRSLIKTRLRERYGGRQADGAAEDKKLVAWMPDPAHAKDMTGWGGTAALGAVLAPPGTQMDPRTHAVYLADQVQAMIDAEDDPEDMLAWAVRERLAPAGLVIEVPAPKQAGMDLVYAMENHLRNMGILTDSTSTIPSEDAEGARESIEETTFEAWIEGVTPAG
jgi:hypothetical protein